MTGKEDANFSFASSVENLKNSICDLLTILNLVHDSDLHVVDDQRQARRIANVFQRLRNTYSECPLHNEFHLTRKSNLILLNEKP